MDRSSIFITRSGADYELLDSGEGEKLERFGPYTLSRPDPQAVWRKRLPEIEWKKADAAFTREKEEGDWAFRKKMDDKWLIGFAGFKMWIKPTAFKHTGLFPEQSANWSWMKDRLKGTKDAEVLNLFGYTGGSTLACAAAGAKVVHIDGSKSAVSWARDNAEASGLGDKPMRWIVEDARKFVEREIKRGRSYDGIVMDPPAFGHGPANELWKIEDHLLPLIESCLKLLKPKPLFFVVNGYAAGYSAIAYKNMLEPLVREHGGRIEIGELAIEESGIKKEGAAKRLLPCGICARWARD